MDPGLRTAQLVGRDVRSRGIRLGLVVDALLDESLRRLVGLDVRCDDDRHCFLPLPACRLARGLVQVDSPLVLMERGVDFYRRAGRPFAELRGLPVHRAGEELGLLADVVVSAEGAVTALVVEGGGHVPPDGAVVGLDALRTAV